MAVINIANRHTNNFNLVRLALALIVAFGHGALIFQIPMYFDWLKIPAVGIFFFLSGIFVSQSFERSPSIKSFLLKRVARIYPAAWFVILCSIFIFGWLQTSCSSTEYFTSSETWRYILENATLFKMEFFHTCLFFSSPLVNQVNASLWSLQYEVIAYTLLLIAGIIGVIKYPRHLIFVVLCLMLVGTLIQHDLVSWRIGNGWLVGMVMAVFFMLGVIVYFERFELPLKPIYLILSIVGLIVLSMVPILSFLTIPLYCYIALYLGSKLKLPKWNWVQHNDISYGIY